MSLHDKVALVTGAAGSGMGRSIALTLAREGAKMVVNYLTSEGSAQEIVAHIKGRGGEAIAVQADVFDAEGCRALVDAAHRAYGRIDICIVGPGGGWHPQPPGALDAAGALEDVRSELAPLYALMPLVLPGMGERNWGRLVALAMHPDLHSPAYAYNVGKAARVQAIRLAEGAVWGQGVTANVIAPGPVPAVEGLEKAVELCDHGPAWAGRTNVTPQDIAEGVAFLCSEGGAYLTGAVLTYRFRG
jgi:NAD(P)-dependent dehydrogenase (short-subunit alcohol dehydrogenase family)